MSKSVNERKENFLSLEMTPCQVIMPWSLFLIVWHVSVNSLSYCLYDHRNIKTQRIKTVISLLYWVHWNHHLVSLWILRLMIILSCCTNYLLRKCRKKSIANKLNCLSTRLLVVTFHEIAINCEWNSVGFTRYFYEP